ncbi:MAG: Uma2 family endonuclease [Candidatus Sumerlaeota bacterium]|nr:Uma2 family endonuclease [Candidatus Sumerlaeota bacterium]
MDALLEQVMASPELPRYLTAIQATFAQEQQLRQRFYEEITESDKAEFINGEIIMHSPASARHIEVSCYLIELLAPYVTANKLGAVYFEKALITLTRNDYEPDICFFGPKKAKSIQLETTRFPAPDFIAEVLSPSTEKNDRGIKFEDYAAHGVAEYWIVDPVAMSVERYLLEDGKYKMQGSPLNPQIESKVIASFSIPRMALFSPNECLKTLRAILATSA